MTEKPSVSVRCLHCDEWFTSALGFATLDVYDSATLIGNITTCHHCGKKTAINKENLRVSTADGGFVGNET